ncbi:uncharacterized protein isoform X3 [Leptinotarsa decemlineata]
MDQETKENFINESKGIDEELRQYGGRNQWQKGSNNRWGRSIRTTSRSPSILFQCPSPTLMMDTIVQISPLEITRERCFQTRGVAADTQRKLIVESIELSFQVV